MSDPIPRAMEDSAAAQRGVPLTVLAPGEPRLAELYGARYALIRPDQHVAWRGDDLPRGRALPIRIMNENYTLFRGASGQAQIVAAKCPHRGAQVIAHTHLG